LQGSRSFGKNGLDGKPEGWHEQKGTERVDHVEGMDGFAMDRGVIKPIRLALEAPACKRNRDI